MWYLFPRLPLADWSLYWTFGGDSVDIQWSIRVTFRLQSINLITLMESKTYQIPSVKFLSLDLMFHLYPAICRFYIVLHLHSHKQFYGKHFVKLFYKLINGYKNCLNIDSKIFPSCSYLYLSPWYIFNDATGASWSNASYCAERSASVTCRP
jgi:hypothetical protein